MMEYKGYMGHVEFDNENGIFHGEVVNIRDVVTFQGESVDQIRQAFKESVDDYLEFCAERGESPEKPYSGKFVVRANYNNATPSGLMCGGSIGSTIMSPLRG